MSPSHTTDPAGARAPRGPRPVKAGHVFVAGYLILLAAFGVLPTAYGIYYAFTNAGNTFAGFSNFAGAARDFRYLPAVGHVALYLVIWLTCLVVFVTGLSVVLQQLPVRRIARVARFLYYIPGALAGAARRPGVAIHARSDRQPRRGVPAVPGLRHFRPGHRARAPVHPARDDRVLDRAGGWIVVMGGALNTIPVELIEAARIDGAAGWSIARRIQIPMIRKWIVYMVILSFAGGTQLFVEPQLISAASLGVAGRDYSLTQLSYDFAFQNNNVNYASAISVELLVVSLVVAALFVTRSRFFDAG